MVVSKATVRFVTEMANPKTYKRVWDSFGSPSIWSLDAFVSDEAVSTKPATGVGLTGALAGLGSSAVIDAVGLDSLVLYVVAGPPAGVLVGQRRPTSVSDEIWFG